MLTAVGPRNCNSPTVIGESRKASSDSPPVRPKIAESPALFGTPDVQLLPSFHSPKPEVTHSLCAAQGVPPCSKAANKATNRIDWNRTMRVPPRLRKETADRWNWAKCIVVAGSQLVVLPDAR